MPKIRKTAKEIEAIIKQSAAKVGPWPRNMSVLVYPLQKSWRVMVGFSNPAQSQYRDEVMAISMKLSETYDLADEQFKASAGLKAKTK